ncbi:hypothetical protein AVBRAN12640_09245 [Campylobacter sp. RM12640]|uniref:hypothetical protein n=1 Tax=unclassified Campylobacter TaxID=2593542 RepID=UPI001BDA6585|nr:MULTISPECIES: hypothetical protein [unclassified Campylobacter]MBZ7975979.1 hypothetical protein [Campylobacter sp. RM12637]MBZ7982719.1 hypothetical protein [Campylobacter sp. RM12640]MBZ7983042.1 hypothetical protein [Campylobacter sp. RM12647]MBZ7988760.1 hypothetical protein [Campylobacter sp. RM12635]MBT0879181.1 hypothetical protein [Campylobacter sp. 2018MI01]
MERIVLILISFLGLLNATNPDYIFWARLSTTNLVLTNEEFHLSRAMSIDKKARYTYVCEINATKSNIYDSLKDQQTNLIDCVNKAIVSEYVDVNNFKASIKTHLRLLPIYFKAELAQGKILIYTKDKV